MPKSRDSRKAGLSGLQNTYVLYSERNIYYNSRD